jgi:CRISPR-associated endonuclease Cas2
VEKTLTKEGLVVKIKEKGEIQILKYDLSDMKPPEGKWDGKWWLVFFDIDKKHSRIRDKLRVYLRQIGMEMFQESVFISPFDITDQVKYLREVLEIPNSIKIARLEGVENEEELKEIFDLK